MNAAAGERDTGQGQPLSNETGEAAGHDELAVEMGQLARSLQQEDTLQETLRGIVAAAVDRARCAVRRPQ